MEEHSKLTFPIVLHIPVLDSSYKNSVVSQTTMWYSVTPATRICWKRSLSTELLLFNAFSAETGQKSVGLVLIVCSSLEFRAATTYVEGNAPWRSWLRHCLTSRKVAVSIPDGVIGIFHWHNPHYDPAVDSASKWNEYQEYFLGGKGGWCVGLTTLPP